MEGSGKKLFFTRGQEVKYIGLGFLGFDKSHTRMTIVRKVHFMSYVVLYRDVTMEVYKHEIAPL